MMEVNDATAASSEAMPETAPEIDTGSSGDASTPESAVDAAFAQIDAQSETEENLEGEQSAEQVDGEPVEGEQPEGEPEKVEAQDEWGEAPSRMSETAKAAWKDAPEAIRADIHRTIQEMEQGIEQHRAAYEPFKELDAHFQQTGQNPSEVFQFYSGMEDLLRQDPVAGMSQIAQNLGLSIEQISEHVLNQAQGPMEGPTYQDQVLQQQSQQIFDLSQQLNGFQQQIAQNQQTEAQQAVAEFAKDHPRVDELANEITGLLQSGMANDLGQAYEMAERLKPAVQVPPAPTPEPNAAQTRKQGSLSVNGAPDGGSNPQLAARSQTPDQAVERALKAAGL